MADPVNLGGDRWAVRPFIAEDPDTGKQIRPYRTFTANGIRQAKVRGREVEAELRAEYEEAQHDRATATLGEATERWWDLWERRPRSPTTRASYRSIIDRHILRSPLAERKVRDIKVGQVDRWYADLTDRMKPATVHRIHAIVRQVFNQCVRDGDLTVNPAANAYKPEARRERRPHTSDDQVRAILAAAWARSPVRARALAFTALTGLRRGEVAGLRWSAVDLEQGVAIIELATVAVNRRFVDDPKTISGGGNGRGMVRVTKGPKAHQVAAIALGDQAAGLVAAQMAWQQAEARAAGVDPAGDPFLWQVRPPFDVSMWPDVLSHWMAAACKTAGEKVRLHDLRHWQASTMLALGASVEEVRERLRHESAQTTLIYLEADKARQRVLVSMLPQLALPTG